MNFMRGTIQVEGGGGQEGRYPSHACKRALEATGLVGTRKAVVGGSIRPKIQAGPGGASHAPTRQPVLQASVITLPTGTAVKITECDVKP